MAVKVFCTRLQVLGENLPFCVHNAGGQDPQIKAGSLGYISETLDLP